jgi:hypothetical protein
MCAFEEFAVEHLTHLQTDENELAREREYREAMGMDQRATFTAVASTVNTISEAEQGCV